VRLSQSWQATHNLRLNTMPLQATSGAASYDAFGGGAAAVVNYIENVFQTQLWTGTGYGQTVNNGIDLSGKGGMVWMKARVASGFGTPYDSHIIEDTNRGAGPYLQTNSTSAEAGVGSTAWMASFNSNGYSFGDNVDVTSKTYVGWTFRKQPKFFDVVTYTGNATNRRISHSLGSTPGFIIVKCTSTARNWYAWHRSLTPTTEAYMILNGTSSVTTGDTNFWGTSAPTSTDFGVGGAYSGVNANGDTYVAYLFAHDAGGFGLTGTDNVISCGTFTTNGSGVGTVTLGYEPQWVLWKRSSGVGDWFLVDNMRGMTTPGTFGGAALRPNLSDAELTGADYTQPTATGFIANSSSSSDFIYISIRRGPMKVPTSGTSVFKPVLYTGTGAAGQTVTASGMNPADTMWHLRRVGDFQTRWDRLRGGGYLDQGTTAQDSVQSLAFDLMTGSKYLTYDSSWGSNATSSDMLNYYFSRAPNFFDVVCYTGTGTATTVTHNLGVVPELIIVKGRSGATAWQIYSSGLANTEYLVLNTTAAKATGATRWNSTTPTSSVFSIGTASEVNTSAATYVAYLFATCAGVSKVGSYTGNGSTQTINCGFTGGARFVMIKKTSATSSWFVWDTSRGMTAGTDPRLFLNNPDGETNTNWVYTASTGFEIVTSDTNINASGSSYIFLAIA